ncbi:hypothetical protein D3C72_2510560 [compost metagenome]
MHSRISSTSPALSKLSERSALPKTKMSLPGCALIVVISPTMSRTIRVLFQSALSRLCVATILAIAFM